MSGTSSLELNEHGAELMNDLAKSFLGQQHTDTKLILKGKELKIYSKSKSRHLLWQEGDLGNDFIDVETYGL